MSVAFRERTKPQRARTRINPYHYLSRDIEGLYLFNETGSRTVLDITGNGHDLLLGGSSGEGTFVEWSQPGGFNGPCIHSLGATALPAAGNIRVPYYPNTTLGKQCSFEAWVNPDVGLKAFGALLHQKSGAADSGFTIDKSGSGWMFDWFDNSGNTHSTTVFTIGPWYHVFATMTTSRVELYVNANRVLSLVPAASAQMNNWNMAFNNDNNNTFVGRCDFMAVYSRVFNYQEIIQRYNNPFEYLLPQVSPPRRSVAQPTTISISPASMKWQATSNAASVVAPKVVISPASVRWGTPRSPFKPGAQTVALTQAAMTIYANTLKLTNTKTVALTQAAMTIYANDIPSPGRALRIIPAAMKYNAAANKALEGVVNRQDCAGVYDAAFSQKFIAGDWLVQIPDLGIKQSFHFDTNDGTWSHNILDISDIEIAVTPGGGLASVNNVTVRLLDNNTNPSATYRTIANIWESASQVEAVACTIDFLLDGQATALRIFTGRIDTISVQDAIVSILMVDDSIQKNLMIPQKLITQTEFPNASLRAFTQPEPLVYGHGSKIGGAPLVLIDVTTNTYLAAAHPMTLGGKLAVYNTETAQFLTLPNIIPVTNSNVQATITIGTLDTGAMALKEQGIGNTSAENLTDGISNTLALIGTAITDSNLTDGVGYAGVNCDGAGYPTTGTIQLSITNHRRSTQSDPTTQGTFTVRTIDPVSSGVLRNLFTAGPFNHTTSLQNNVYQISNVAIGVNEQLEVLVLARSIGTVGNTSQTYEVGEISITPIVVYSANTSGLITAITVPTTIQELRFNRTSYTLSVQYQNFVSNASAAIDGISTTLAYIGTSGTDSNLDGIGELVVAANQVSVTSAQRANNIVVVDFANHRRSPGSDPTVTGTFSIRTVNSNGQILRDNLANYGPFRHTLNPLDTSYTAPAINLGFGEQVAVRLVARNEGNPGSAVDQYEVGEIGFVTYYQPQGDTINIALFGADTTNEYLGRTDPDGSVTGYVGLGTGTLLETPDEVIASMLVQEMALPLDAKQFAAAFNFFTANGFVFDGGIGLDWAVTRSDARAILNDLAKFGTAIIAPTFAAQWGVRPYRTDIASRMSFDTSNILYGDGAEGQRSEDRQSTFILTLGNLQTVYNHFEVHYHFNVGSKLYDRVYTIDPQIGTNLPSDALDAALLNAKCIQSFNRYGKLAPLIIEAYWIADDHSAQLLMRHLVNYFSEQRIVVEFDTTFVAACLQVGDLITVTYPSLPAADNGQTYEVHTIRYQPNRGRIHLVASRTTTLNTTIQITPASMKFHADKMSVGALTITISPASMKWKAPGADDLQATMAYSESWEYLPATSDDSTLTEGWTTS